MQGVCEDTMRPRDVEAVSLFASADGFRRNLNQQNCYFCNHSISHLSVGSTWSCMKWNFTFGDGENGIANMVEHICDLFEGQA